MTQLPGAALRGRSAIVFGGTSGINLGIARAFCAHGAHVFVVSRKQENVDTAVESLRGDGGHVDGLVADVRDFDAVTAVAATVAEKAGGIDIVVSGAAGNFLASAETISSNGFRTVVDIDLIGTFHAARACHPHLRTPGASIINITAPQGTKPMIDQVHACAAKAGVNMLTRCLALEWGPQGIRVNAISPGPIGETEGMRRLAPSPEAVNAITGAVPLRRFGTIAEIAEAACYLACADYVNGVVLDVDGGVMLGTGGIV